MTLLFLCLAAFLLPQVAEDDRFAAHRALLGDAESSFAVRESITVEVVEEGQSVKVGPVLVHVERDPDDRVRIEIRDFIVFIDDQVVSVVDVRNDETYLAIAHEGRPAAVMRELFAEIPSLWLQFALGTSGDRTLLESLHPSLSGFAANASIAESGDQRVVFRSPDATVTVDGVLPGRLELEVRAGDWVEPGGSIRWEVTSEAAQPGGTAFTPEGRMKVDHLALLGPGPEEASLEVGDQAPPLRTSLLAGGAFDLADELGQIVVIDFWATWCQPCRAALPRLQALSERLDELELPVRVLTVNTSERAPDREALRALVQAACTELGLGLPVLMDIEGTVAREWGVSALPTTIVVDQEGRVAFVHQGAGADFIDRLEVELRQLVPPE